MTNKGMEALAEKEYPMPIQGENESFDNFSERAAYVTCKRDGFKKGLQHPTRQVKEDSISVQEENKFWLIEYYFWKDTWINEEPSYRFFGTKTQCLKYIRDQKLENVQYNPKQPNEYELSWQTDERRNYLIKISEPSPLPNPPDNQTLTEK